MPPRIGRLLRSSASGLVERGPQVPGEFFGGSHAPEVQEQDPWFLTRHVAVDGDHVDPCFAKSLEDPLQLGEAALHDRTLVGPREGSPGVDTDGTRRRIARGWPRRCPRRR